MKILKKIGIALLAILALLAIIYLSGPRTRYEPYNNDPLEGVFSLEEVQQRIQNRNSEPNIKLDNEEKIIWSNDIAKTEYAFVYLHGFSASHGEGAPMHQNLAKRFKANLFLSRLPYHGLDDEDAFANLTPGALVAYAKEAIKIGKSIGDKLILVSCSSGSTLSAFLAAKDPEIEALIMFSPNFEIQDASTKILTKPWGLQLARKIKKGKYHEWNAPQAARPYWYHKYRLEGVIALQSLIEKTMNDELFEEIKAPTFIGYYYKDEVSRDMTISTPRIEEVKEIIGTPPEKLEFIAYPEGNAHVFIHPIFNPQWEQVQEDVIDFLEEKVGLESQVEQVELQIKEGVSI